MLIAILLPIAAAAQQWELKAGGGGTFMTLPTKSYSFNGSKNWYSLSVQNTERSLTAAGFFSIGRSGTAGRLSFGLRATITSLRRYVGTTQGYWGGQL
jgi:hypothetical protein